MGKIRCPLRPSSMKLDRGGPETITPPEHPPACCTEQTIKDPATATTTIRLRLEPPHGRKQSASWPMAGIDWVCDVSASRLNGPAG